MKISILSFCVLIYVNLTSWITYEVDGNVSIQIPQNFSTNEYKNQVIIIAALDSINLFLSHQTNKVNFEFVDEQDLLKGYDYLIEGYLISFKNVKDPKTNKLNIDKLIAKQVKFRAEVNNIQQEIYAAFIIVENKTYVIQYMTPYSSSKIRDARRFVEGINFRDTLTIKNQTN